MPRTLPVTTTSSQRSAQPLRPNRASTYYLEYHQVLMTPESPPAARSLVAQTAPRARTPMRSTIKSISPNFGSIKILRTTQSGPSPTAERRIRQTRPWCSSNGRRGGRVARGAWGEWMVLPVLTRTPTQGKQLGGCAVAAGLIPDYSPGCGNWTSGDGRREEGGGGQSRGSSPLLTDDQEPEPPSL